MVAPAFAGSAPMVISRVFLSASELSSPREVPAAAIIPQHSPPGRASILRI
jgi:hypothetical protein